MGQDKTGLRLDKSQQEKNLSNVEKDKQLSKEMIEKLKSERYELNRQVYALKKRADESERKYYDAKLKIKSYERIEQKKLASLKERESFTSTKMSASTPHLNTPVPAEEHVQKEKVIQELPDFDSLRLHIESLESEKRFLFTENNALKDSTQNVIPLNIAKQEGRQSSGEIERIRK